MNETVPPVSRLEYTSKVPCYKCILFVMCKQRMLNSVVSFAHGQHGCPEVKDFVMASDQTEINAMRVLFGLQEYP